MQAPETIKLQGGALSLDFANSADWTEAGEPIEDALVEPDSFERWGRRVLGAPVCAGEDELAAARELRPALRAVLVAAAHGETPERGARDLLMRTYAEAVATAELTARDGAYVLDWRNDDPRKVRFAVTADALALLADPDRLQRIHVCPGRNCGWLFLNKSGRQRWCSMDTCGSRAKMRAMYERRRSAQQR
jgi:predicted RNA-binding Zn ribbon-like protein